MTVKNKLNALLHPRDYLENDFTQGDIDEVSSGILQPQNINSDTVPLLPGMPVASVAGGFKRARNDSYNLSCLAGLVVIGAEPTLLTVAISSGALKLTANQWKAITGEIGGLSPGRDYYVDLLPGTLTYTAPVTGIVVNVGRSIDETTMLVKLSNSVTL